MSKLPSYVLITPARNEARSIEQTIKSVIAQTVLPLRWVIVSDGSTDGTDDIIKKYVSGHPWMRLIRMPERPERHFAGKVYAFNAGHAAVGDLSYEVVCSLDGDISFDRDYFEFLLAKLTLDSSLGLVGTPFKEESAEIYDYRFVNIEHVSGACQVFRRECFDAIGGYLAVKGGAIDNIAVITARMKGWKTRTFIDKICLHHRQMGTAERSTWKARFKFGAKDYAIGNHPLWELFRAAYQMTKKPVIVGGAALGAGYLWACLRRAERPVSSELMTFHRREQMQRLKKLFGAKRIPTTTKNAAATS